MQVKTLGEHRMVDTDDEIVHDIIERDLEVCNQTAGKYFSYLIFGNKEFKTLIFSIKILLYRAIVFRLHV